jgi:hypothetical protein
VLKPPTTSCSLPRQNRHIGIIPSKSSPQTLNVQETDVGRYRAALQYEPRRLRGAPCTHLRWRSLERLRTHDTGGLARVPDCARRGPLAQRPKLRHGTEVRARCTVHSWAVSPKSISARGYHLRTCFFTALNKRTFVRRVLLGNSALPAQTSALVRPEHRPPW